MTETINRIEEALEQNWAVEAEDIRALVEAYKEKDRMLRAIKKSLDAFPDIVKEEIDNFNQLTE